MAAPRKEIDWEGVESHYRAGIRTVRDIAAEYGCSHTAINQRAAKYKWVRDLSAKIREAAAAKVSSGALSTILSTPERLATERDIIESNAELLASITRSHRSDIQRYRNLAMAILAEIEELTADRELIGSIVDALNSGDEGRMSDAVRKVMSIPTRTDSLKKLADTLKTLVGLERQAFGLDDSGQGGDHEKSLEQLR